MLRKQAAHHTFSEIAGMLGRTHLAVQKRASDLRILRGTCAPDWSDAEIADLRRLFPVMRTADVAERLGRGVNAVSVKARSLGIVKDPSYIHRARGNAARAINGKRVTAPFRQQRPVAFEGDNGAWTPTQDAVRHLQRLAPIWRCNAKGEADPKGMFWKFSGTVMDAAAVEARAKRAGWSAP